MSFARSGLMLFGVLAFSVHALTARLPRLCSSRPLALGLNRNHLYFNRLQKELANFRKDPPPNCTLEVFGSRSDIWIITWTGLPGTLYAGEKYRLKILFPKEYPLKPPVVYFLQPSPVHAHVYSNGDICMSSLGSDYVPTASVASFVLSIISMLSNAKEKRLPADNHLLLVTMAAWTATTLCQRQVACALKTLAVILFFHLHLVKIAVAVSDAHQFRPGILTAVNPGNRTSIPSLEYLGLGYDVVEKAHKDALGSYNNDGSEFKAPIVRLVWPESGSRRYNNTLRWKLPRNVYAWRVPFYSIRENTANSKYTKTFSDQLTANFEAKSGPKPPDDGNTDDEVATDGEVAADDGNTDGEVAADDGNTDDEVVADDGNTDDEVVADDGDEQPAGEDNDALAEPDSAGHDEVAAEDEYYDDLFASLLDEGAASADSPYIEDAEDDPLSLDDDPETASSEDEENPASDEASLSAKLSIGNSASAESSKSQLSRQETCVAFVAGVLINRTTFDMAVIHLLRALGRHDACTLRHYGHARCGAVRMIWFDFFRQWGTHAITRITLGGEVTLITQKSQSESSGGKQNSAALSARAKAINAHVDAQRSDVQASSAADNQSSCAMDMLGGRPQAGLDRGELDTAWARTTQFSPMPIKMELTPLAFVFKPLGHEHHYYRALALYARNGTGTSSTM
ncbi:ubiquitin-conjugating enzyme E2, putative [Babesia bigemina]|uniref:Ubiquitin-conjugating enzyme E2, putative n=1 Tax=Babesia bigemina TaxID=5866 RepID=A0A061D4Z2_BABBI|nr:ubiquitin-conjugating enzyme E2, putative [Babesia bigemina]CDR94029.1 ubiquitin-conjugating enzyme E2, putative [Babesia bigemina]|eukprot:XP_012766215.1 ubiquitin-conjugating enzyme E2, putative [Babesia bigemina]